MMDAAARLTAIEDLKHRAGAIGSELYALSQQRWQLTLQLRAAIRTLTHATAEKFGRHARRGIGVNRLTVEWLGAHGARYLLIDSRGPRGGYENGSRLSIRTFRVEVRGDDRLVLDEATGAVVGRVCEASRDHDVKDTSGHPVPAWRDPAFHAPGMNHDEALLPLDGPALAHGLFRVQADFAVRAEGGRVPFLEDMRRLDADVARLCAERDGIAEQAMRVARTGIDVDDIERRHADIVAAMKRHDWTWHMADRPNYARRDSEDDLLATLGAIPEEEAILLWHRHAWSPMDLFPWSRARERIARLPGRALPRAA